MPHYYSAQLFIYIAILSDSLKIPLDQSKTRLLVKKFQWELSYLSATKSIGN